MAPTPRLLLGLLLTACAGFIDAIGFIELGGYFTSFMSGNTTQLGIDAIGSGIVLVPLSLVVLFFVGSFLGSLLALRGDPRLVLGFVIASVALTLALSLAGLPASQTMLILAAGAGAQNAVLPFAGGARLGTTFVTGTLFAAGQDLAHALAGTVPRWRWAQHLMVWFALLAGALIGAMAHRAVGISAIVTPGLIYAAMIVGFTLRRPAAT